MKATQTAELLSQACCVQKFGKMSCVCISSAAVTLCLVFIVPLAFMTTDMQKQILF